MHLYEIKAASFVRKLNELSSADIDRDLEKTSGEISRASSLNQGDETAAGVGAGDNLGAGDLGAGDFGAAPDPAAGQSPLQMGEPGDELAADDALGADNTAEEEDEMLMQKVDSTLVSVAKGHQYTRGYNHQDNSKIHPYKILSMTMDELMSLRTMARNKANIESFNGELGAMDNPDIKFFQDLVSYMDKIIEVKKSATKEYKDGKEGKTAKHEKRPESKIKPGKVKEPKAK